MFSVSSRRRLSVVARRRSLPLVLLAVVSVLSLGARVALLRSPCRAPCDEATDHVLVFDEAYYVNAARLIAGIALPQGAHYAGSPVGDDANSEHPQLVKLVMAGSIELFGDGPLAWRLGSIVLGSVAILGMYFLVRSAGGGAWAALGAATLMAVDNLALVHSRIGTLDIYAVTAMIFGAALYLRRRPLLAGVVIGVGACTKLVAPYVLLSLLGLELLGAVGRPALADRVKRLVICAGAAAGTLIGLLALLDRVAPPYDPIAGKGVTGGVFGHIHYMLSYAAHQTSPHGPQGIASYPWEWLIDLKPILYLNINPDRPVPGLYHAHPAAHFLGMINPVILLAGLPGLVWAGWRLARGGTRAVTQLEALALTWAVGTWVPFLLLSVIDRRTSYLYYMLVVMPGIYVAAVTLVVRWRPDGRLVAAWGVALLVAVAVMYPFTPVP
jgi:predicted membrane-bound dolichyl-phosphate-mannose-protein mannosyltransferase